ncbi:hypothetical protein OKA05_27600 [Luteolibacter arcticus]|uniref:DUF218 domain-containing protein n=1 Tax=Luteolibacter arcticus TaxID=1581411 RepID=A0ABT3GS82_9BACT|nr:hypothetical protein [Luteolibacter arcticus]MCW1926347.1 hypothetical protein [Luteolibacter arcticus]
MLRALTFALLLLTPLTAAEKRIAVFVGLCDNATQGIVKVGAKIGDGDKPADNLYWGCTDGLRSHFKASKRWKLEKTETATGDDRILERVTFRHVSGDAILVAEAWRGSKLKDCYEACEKAMLSGDNDLVTFIGHNVLMDVAIDAPAEKAKGKTDAIVLCCISDRYFRQRLENAGVRPVVLTTQLMYPGSFILHDALEPWLQGKARGNLRDAAGLAYARNQNLKPAAAKGVFARLDP